MIDNWSGLADFLANMIEKYAEELHIDELPMPERPERKEGEVWMFGEDEKNSLEEKKIA